MISRLQKNKYIKCCFIIIVCYLLASIGVNGIINPSYYFKKSEEYVLNYYEDNNCLYIDITRLETADQYLNINISELQRFGSVVYLYTDVDSKERIYTLLCKGSNSIKKSQFPLNTNMVYIKISDLAKDGVKICQITASSERQVDCFSMLKVFFSFILLATIWCFIGNLKKKYTM